jgi:ribosomal protein S18 acetylase RimI-like enzyme
VKEPVIRAAKPSDTDQLFAMMRALAKHDENLKDFTLTRQKLKKALFGRYRLAFCAIAQLGHASVGFATWFHAYSSLDGARVIFLEDLYVRPRYRRKGVGRLLLKYVGGRAIAAQCPCIAWGARSSNTEAVSFYKSLSAKQYLDRSNFVLTGKALAAVAGEGS